MSPRETGILTVAGQHLEYAWFGPAPSPDGPAPVLCLHEGLGCVGLWKDVPGELAARAGRPVFVYSRIGYGKSDPCPLPRSYRYMHEEALHVLPALIDALGLTVFVLFGHSDGASISLIAAGGGVIPGLKGMILEAPHVFMEEINVQAITEARAAYTETDLREKLQKYHGDNVDCAFYGWADTWLHEDFADWNIEEYLSAIGVPVLLIQGRQDAYGSMAQLDHIAAAVAGLCHRLELDECGHSPHRDQRHAVMNAAGNFLRML